MKFKRSLIAFVCAIGLFACRKPEQQPQSTQQQPQGGTVGTTGQGSQGTVGTTSGTPGAPSATVSRLPAVTLNGQVLTGGRPIANSAVTLWSATAGYPAQLGQVDRKSVV